MLDKPGISAKRAIDILDNLGRMELAKRRDIYRLTESDDKQERHVALTKAAQLPPPPEPGLRFRPATRQPHPRFVSTGPRPGRS